MLHTLKQMITIYSRQLAAAPLVGLEQQTAHDRIAQLHPRALFLSELARDPRSMGAICSSSQQLGTKMARHIDLQRDGCVVELGGGTGVITRALLMHGVPPGRLIVIEKSRLLAAHLRARFPKVKIIHGDAADVDIIRNEGLSVNALVSSLPLRSLPDATVASITSNCASILQPHGRLIQYTYAFGGRSPWLRAGLSHVGSETVWGNLPPARIDVFSAPSA